jgi:hypothetical protein
LASYAKGVGRSSKQPFRPGSLQNESHLAPDSVPLPGNPQPLKIQSALSRQFPTFARMLIIRSAFFLLVVSCVLTACGQTRQVTLTINYYVPYCGGARPTEQIIAEAERPKPYANQTIVFVKGSKVDSAKTNVDGVVTKKLKTGNYQVFESWRYYKKAPGNAKISEFNKECLKGEWKKPLMTLTVRKTSHSYDQKFELVEFCDHKRPCLINPGPERQ